MGSKRAFVIGAVTGTAFLWLASSLVSDDTTLALEKTPAPDRLNDLRPTVEPEPDPQRSHILHGSRLPTRDLLEELGNATTDAQKIRIIDRMGQVKLHQAVPKLTDISETGQGALRSAAITALGGVGGSQATDILIGLSESNVKKIRSHALSALGKTGHPDAITWLKEIAESNLLRMGQEAQNAIAQLGDDIHTPYFVRMMNHVNTALATGAAQALATLGTPRARRALFRLANKESGGSVRLAAIRGLSGFDDQKVVSLLEKLMSHEQRIVAETAIASYAHLAPTGAVETLAHIAQHGRRSLQGAATRGLAATGSFEARDELINILFAENSRTHTFAAKALAEIGDEESIKALADGLQGGREVVLASLKAMELAPTHPLLTTAVSDLVSNSDADLSSKASQILAKHIGEKAIPTILKALQKFKKYNRRIFCHILGGIDGEASTQALLDLVGTGAKSLPVDALTALVHHGRITQAVARELAIDQLRQSKNSRSTKRLVQILAKQEHAASDKHILELIETTSIRQIRSIISAISKEGGAKLVDETIAHIRRLPAGHRREEMVGSLDLDRPENRDFLLEIASGNGEEAASVLTRFAWHSPKKVRGRAFDAMKSDNVSLRVSAVRVFRGINGTEEINALADLAKDPEDFVKMRALDALGHNEEPYAKDVLIDAFDSGDSAMRVASAYHIAHSGHPRALNLLVEAALSDRKNGSFFYQAIENLKSPESKQALTRIKELAPPGHQDLQEDILNSALEAEDLSNQAAFGGGTNWGQGFRGDLLHP